MVQGSISDDDIAGLTQRTDEANLVLLRGDIEGYLALIKHSEDYTLLAPHGGETDRGFEPSPERIAGMKPPTSQLRHNRNAPYPG